MDRIEDGDNSEFLFFIIIYCSATYRMFCYTNFAVSTKSRNYDRRLMIYKWFCKFRNLDASKLRNELRVVFAKKSQSRLDSKLEGGHER